MKKLFSFLFSGEFLFAVFLLSGVFKEVFEWIPLDLTVLTMVLTMIVALKRIYKKSYLDKRVLSMLILFLMFTTTVITSMLYTDSTSYFLDKGLRFIVITAWAFICPFFVLNTRESIKKFIFSLSIIAVVSSVFIIRNFFFNTNVNTNFVSLSDGNYLGSARLVGTGAVGLLVYYLYKETNKSTKIFALLSLLLVSVSLIMTGARMPVIAYSLTFFALFLTTIKIKNGVIYMRKGTKRVLLLLALAIPSVYYLKDAAFTQTLQNRISVLFEDGMGDSAAGRLDRFDTAFDMMRDNFLFGGGFGSFGVNYSGVDGREYPHNIFLEVGSELGLLGLLLITMLIVLGFTKSMKSIRKGDYVSIWVFASLVYLLANAMVSGSLNDNRMFFALLGVAAHSSIYLKTKEESTEEQVSFTA